MDARSKANFINSVAGGQGIPCPNCNTLNEADSKFCIACGTQLVQKKSENTMPFAAAEPVQEPIPTPVAEPDQEKEATPASTLSRQPFPTAEPVQPRPVQSRQKQAEQPKSAAPTVKYIEPESVFAEGLPSWDIEPPQVVVRRKRK